MNIKKIVLEIRNKKTVVGLIGIGYVGRAIGESAARAGYTVLGYGRSEKSVGKINTLKIKKFRATTNLKKVLSSEIVCVCVPTPVTHDKVPDITALKESLTSVSRNLKRGQLIIIESSIAPGTTRNVALPILEESGLVVEKDYFLAFSPERIDPGNKSYTFADIAKVVAGIGPHSAALSYEFYKSIIKDVHVASSVEVAEMSKMLENTFRLINISFINEMSMYTDKMGIDIWEVIDAAKTKPFGFMPHYPGPGIGGHCIPVDPYYILRDAKERYGVDLRMVEEAGRINENQPLRVVENAMHIIKQYNGVKKKHRALIVGVTYKEDVDDTRETPATQIIQELEKREIEVEFYDPYISEFEGRRCVDLLPDYLSSLDVIIIVTPHAHGIMYENLVGLGIPILDTKNTLKRFDKAHIYNLFQTSNLFTDVASSEHVPLQDSRIPAVLEVV